MTTTITGYDIAPAQQRIWLLEKNGCRLGNQMALAIEGTLDPERLTWALHQICSRHESLRTVYRQPPTLFYPLQVIGEESRLRVTRTDLSGYAPDQQLLEADRLYEAVRREAGAAAEKGVMEVHLLRLGAEAHRLVIKLPAMASDPCTLVNIARELGEIYEATGTQEDDAPLQYVQYSEWQNNSLNEEGETAPARPGQDNPTEGTDFTLPFEGGGEAAAGPLPPEVLAVAVDPRLHESLAAFARQEGMAVPTLLQACWNLLIWGYLDCPAHLVTGSMEAGRPFEAFARINGAFAKALPVPLSIRKEQTLRAVCATLGIALEKARQDDTGQGLPDAPFTGQQVPFFRVLFEHTPVPAPGPAAGTVRFSIRNLYSCMELFRLKLTFLDDGEEPELQFYYHPAHFDRQAIELVKDQFLHLLTRATSRPDAPVMDLFTPSRRETDELLPAFNRTSKVFPAAASVIGLFEAQAESHPNHPAVVHGPEELTYGQLNRRANQLAHYLVKHYQTGPGSTVAVCLPRSPEAVLAILAVLKTGAAYLPLNVDTPPERLAFMLADSGAGLFIAGPESPADGIPTLVLNGASPFEGQPGTNPAVPKAATDPVYLIYTSGSTGKPKGVFISDASLRNYVGWFTDAYGIGSRDRTLLFSSLAFDLAYTSLWPALTAGSTLYLLEETPLLDPAKLTRSLIRNRITFIKLTPSHLKLLLNNPGFAEQAERYALRLVVLGGEEIKVADVEEYFRHQPDVTFVNHYGPTETTIGTIAKTIRQSDLDAFKRRPVLGRPIANNQIYILDERENLLPVGMAGEICVGGKGLAQGYLNRADMTTRKFIPHPFQPGSTLYKTGDLGRWLPNGDVQFLGRKDFQVKIRGYRVELGEIENELNAHDRIREAVVMASGEAGAEKQLIAYVSSNQPVSMAELRDFLGRRLPAYMIPAQLVVLPELPLMPNGKVDRKALQEKPLTPVREGRFVAPDGDVEKQLVALWQKLLGKEQVGVKDNFFDLGGNSLKLVMMLQDLSQLFPGRISLTDLFRYNTIRSITSFLNAEPAPAAPASVESQEV